MRYSPGHLRFGSLILAKLKDKINFYLSFRNLGTPKYPGYLLKETVNICHFEMRYSD